MSTEAKTGKHPKGLYVLFITEMWERFSYYGMRAIFILYMTKALLFDKGLASLIYGNYTGLVYLTPLIGGYVADRYWGNRRSIFWGGVMMAIGQFLLFGSAVNYETIAAAPDGFSMAHMMFFGGLGFLIFGNGFFKPNISTMVGQLYPKSDTRLDSAMTIFYMGINLGAFIAPLVTGFLGDTGCPADFKWGFLAAGTGMIISIILFETLKKRFIVTPEGNPVGLPPKQQAQYDMVHEDPIDTPEEVAEEVTKSGRGVINAVISLAVFIAIAIPFYMFVDADIVGAIMYALAIAAPLWIILDPSLSKIEKQRIGVIYICAAFVIFFWSAFEQAGASLTFFADEQTNRSLDGIGIDWTIPASFFQSFNALFIVAFAPILAWLWTWLGKKGKEPASPYKQSIGLFLLAMGYLFIAFFVKGIDPEAKVTMFALIGLYWLHTMGELALSPIGLSMVVKLSPVKFTSLLMGVWFLSMATSNKLAGVLSGLYPEEQKKEFAVPLGDFKDQLTDAVWYEDPILEIGSTGVWDVTVNANEDSKDKDAELASLAVSGSDAGEYAKYKAKRILKDNKLLLPPPDPNAEATVDETSEAVECATTEDLGKFTYGVNSAGDHFYLAREVGDEATVQVWTFEPEKPSFFGMKINSLYDFFMIFVFMAGAASIILFFLSRKLVRMMHGVR